MNQNEKWENLKTKLKIRPKYKDQPYSLIVAANW